MANVPPPRDQLATSTCTSWSVTYAAASQATRRNGLGAGVTLSPAYTYNQVSGDRVCHPPTSISKTLELLREHGALPIEEFVFDPGWCGRQPTEAERKRAQRYCITDWSRFEAGNVEAVKAQIARGVPVIFNMRVGTKLRGQRGDGVIDSDEGDMADMRWSRSATTMSDRRSASKTPGAALGATAATAGSRMSSRNAT